MNARDEIEEFIETLSVSRRIKSDKKRYLLQFADFFVIPRNMAYRY